MPSKWQRLHVSSSGSVPTLLYQLAFTEDGYELYITDLTYIWSEHLDRVSILRRADEDDTTIDPSEDDDQFTVLLQKIEEALHHDSSGHSAALSRGSEGANLHLLTTTKLPAPLQPLLWRFYLSQDPHSAATDQLLLPLVKAEAVWQSREQVLIDQLMKKDWVLGKLFDKLEALGIDIGTIFPGVSGHRPGQKDTMLSHTAKYIQGVEPFDKDSWIRETNVSFPELSSAANLATEATGSGVSDADRFQNLTAPPDGWWKRLSTAIVDSSSDNEPRKPAVDKRPFDGSLETDTDSGNEDDDDEFEVCFYDPLGFSKQFSIHYLFSP
ncbi:XLF-domain-containing protein [Aspergillus violaceofuscus CBS 115571]|uniref:Non-homologous end-joining factor 1 n=1 Tax=Aspergillus violaceofuscus (strain CBS 115571) TaxID=1450538 RepID=A0A2V5H3W1_ASPV1|nr:XLF-domain-containing protein [Aspergillus violaceofuscus CBS 115571]